MQAEFLSPAPHCCPEPSTLPRLGSFQPRDVAPDDFCCGAYFIAILPAVSPLCCVEPIARSTLSIDGSLSSAELKWTPPSLPTVFSVILQVQIDDNFASMVYRKEEEISLATISAGSKSFPARHSRVATGRVYNLIE